MAFETGCSFSACGKRPRRALVNRAVQRLGHAASIPRPKITCPSPEALGPGSRRVPRRRYADPPAGAFLTALGTAVGPASRHRRRRDADAPPAAVYLVVPPTGFARTWSFSRNDMEGAPPLAHARVKRRQCRRRPGRSPRSSALSQILTPSKGQTRLCRPALRAALKGGRSPSTRVALALATPGLADGQGAGARCALRP